MERRIDRLTTVLYHRAAPFALTTNERQLCRTLQFAADTRPTYLGASAAGLRAVFDGCIARARPLRLEHVLAAVLTDLCNPERLGGYAVREWVIDPGALRFVRETGAETVVQELATALMETTEAV